MSVPTTINELWKQALQQGAEQAFLKLPVSDAASLATFKRGSFLSRALRFTEIFTRELQLTRGSRVLLIGIDVADLSLLLHGLWIGGLVPVVIDAEAGQEFLEEVIKNCRVSVVIFPPAGAARISQLISSQSTVKRWIVTGGGFAPGGGGQVSRLEELLSRVGSIKFDLKLEGAGSDDALITFTGVERKSVLLSHRALLLGSSRWTKTVEGLPDGALIESALSPDSLASIQFSYLLPLFSSVVAVVRRERESGKVWEQIVADSIGCTLFSQDDVFTIVRKPKPRALTIPEASRIALLTKSVVSSELLRTLAEKVGVKVITMYWATEAGGIVALSPVSYTDEWNRTHRLSRNPPVSGALCDGVSVKIGKNGELEITSDSVMSGYEGPVPGAMKLQGNTLLSSDFGELVGGDSLLAVYGKKSERVDSRGGYGYASAVDGVVRIIKGVEWSRTIILDAGSASPRSLGTYVVTVRMSTLTREEVFSNIKNSLPEPYWPDKITIVKGGKEGAYPSDEELRKLI